MQKSTEIGVKVREEIRVTNGGGGEEIRVFGQNIYPCSECTKPIDCDSNSRAALQNLGMQRVGICDSGRFGSGNSNKFRRRVGFSGRFGS